MITLLSVAVAPTAAFDVRLAPASVPTLTPEATPQYPELSGPDVVSFPISDLPIRNGKRTVIQGTRQAGGACVFTHKTPPIGRGDPIPAGSVLAYDRKSCKALIEEGEYDGPPIETLPRHNTPRPTPIPAASSRETATVGNVHPLAVTMSTYRFEYKGWWKDPPGITVSEARPYVIWSTNGESTTDCSGNTSTWWNSSSGWYEVQKDISVRVESGTRCVSEANVHHQNDIFCAGITTHAYYRPIRIAGYPWGDATGFEETWVEGSGCADWLSYAWVGPYPI